MAVKALDACLDMDFMAVCNRLFGSCINLISGENHPNDDTRYDQDKNYDQPETVHFTFEGKKDFP
jgi:hypothetical protein